MRETPTTESLRGDHSLNITISHELKQRLVALARRYDRTIADTVRQVLRVGMPVIEGITEAEEELIREYINAARRLRQMRGLKDI